MKRLFAILLVLSLVFVSCGESVADVSSADNAPTSSEQTSSETINNNESGEFMDTNLSNGQLIINPEYPSQVGRDYDYEVTITQGDDKVEIPVYNPARLHNSFSPANGGTDDHRRFCEFSFTEEVTVSVKVNLPTQSYSVMPTMEGIQSTFENGVITFTLKKPTNVVVRLNDNDSTNLCIFAEAPAEEFDWVAEVSAGRSVIYFDAGFNNLDKQKTTATYSISQYGQLNIPQDTTLYLAPGALVSYRLLARKDNIKIMGRGAIIDPRTDRSFGESHMILAVPHAGSGAQMKNFTVEGIRVLDSHCFNIDLTSVNGANIRGVKVLSSEVSTDGVTVRNDCSNITVEDSFFYISDNNVVVSEANENILVKNCTFGSSYGVFYPQGKTTKFTLENIYLFNCGNFFRVAETTASNGNWEVYGKNIYAQDVLKMSGFIYFQNQGDVNNGVATFENVFLPSENAAVTRVNASGFTFNLNNVYFGEKAVKNESAFSQTSNYGNSMKFNFGTEFNSNGIPLSRDSHKVDYKGEERIKIGGYNVSFDKNASQEINGAQYFPADNILKALGFKVSVDSGILTAENSEQNLMITKNSTKINGKPVSLTAGAVVLNDQFMLSEEFFETALGLEVNGLSISPIENRNLVFDPGFENIHNTITTDARLYAYSHDWTHFNFGQLFEEQTEVYDGKTSLRLTTWQQSQSGLAQYLAPQIKQYGKGTYRISLYAKCKPTSASATSLPAKLGIVQSGWRFHDGNDYIGIADVGDITITDTWQKFTYDVKVTDPTLVGYDSAFMFLGFMTTIQYDVFVDNVEVTFIK